MNSQTVDTRAKEDALEQYRLFCVQAQINDSEPLAPDFVRADSLQSAAEKVAQSPVEVDFEDVPECGHFLHKHANDLTVVFRVYQVPGDI